jgi:alkylation response protein AidB-like acyl-CoA dehydrogenase
MNFARNEEQVMLGDAFRRFFRENVSSSEIGRGPVHARHWGALAELGMVTLILPERAGGLDGSPRDTVIIAEEVGRALAITPFAEGIVAATCLVARYGRQDLVERWVAPTISGRATLALAIGAVTVDGAGRLAGSCPLVRWAPGADGLVVTVGSQAFVVANDEPGLRSEPVTMIDGTPAATIHLDRASAERIALPDGALATTLAMAQLCYVGEMVGAMSLLYEQTIDYVRQRKQFGVAIATFQVVQHKLARMFVMLEQARSLMLKAAICDREDPGFVHSVTAAKAYVAQVARRLAEDAVQLHGGIGITDELVAGRGLRRVTVLARLFGSAEDARARLIA